MSVLIGSVYVGICMWVQAYLDGCECFHRECICRYMHVGASISGWM